MALPQPLTEPVPLAVLTISLAALLWWQQRLGYGRYKRIHALKKRFFPLLNNVWPHFVHNKKAIGKDGEFVGTWDTDLKSCYGILDDAGATPHLLCSIKKRPSQKRYDYSELHFVWTHNDGTQTEAYLFQSTDGGYDVYAHNEAVITDVQKHLTGPQIDGDPNDVVQFPA